jgi:hypothetical protein
MYYGVLGGLMKSVASFSAKGIMQTRLPPMMLEQFLVPALGLPADVVAARQRSQVDLHGWVERHDCQSGQSRRSEQRASGRS